MRRLAVALVLVACGGGSGPDVNIVDGPSNINDAPDGCVVSISFEPAKPIVGNTVRLRALATNAGVITGYTWTVLRGAVPYSTQAALDDGSEVTFVATDAGMYRANVEVANAGAICFDGQNMFDVKPIGAGQAAFRFHVLPPAGDPRPPFDDLAIVDGGTTDTLDNDFVLPSGALRNGTVVDPSGAPVAAYLRFAPVMSRDAAVEAYAGANGAYSAQLGDTTHELLIIPRSSELAPRRMAWQPGTTQFTVDGGVSIVGRVRVGGTAVAGATVQLTINGVPTTIGTTDAGGGFALRGVPAPGAVVDVEVTPPAARGIPRLIASTTALDLAQLLTIDYAAVTERNLAGTVIRRGGTPVANAAVSIIAADTLAATVSTGAASVPALGIFQGHAVANGAGVLPQLLAPDHAGSAVITASAGDVSIASINLASGVPAAIAAGDPVPVTTELKAGGLSLDGVTVDFVPVGSLALANVPAVRATTNVAGLVGANLASGGRYDVRIVDPRGRGAPTVLRDVGTSQIFPVTNLANATLVGTLVSDGTQPLRGALVQILCNPSTPTCTGLERSRPIAEGVTGIDGRFSLAVPDPTP